ncbi:S24/S26 family peptidase [Curtobacterium sp. A7_M15]|uniref:S24/S26 family peptidase n=1 Tax=Curtobacterium sp. A7_M15 TaxID=3065241 RepID=UPI002737B0D1|nr:S24/S26 family peptidase [Curtobacterium sp. A7_M15]MDP4334684.1 S24/S26 family peptidase [Curtobacterium sp. A7_M15]
MVSIEVHGGHTPHDVLRDAVDWGRVVVATLARGVVATLLGLALWAAAPAVIGWQPTTVMTGSMEPRLTPGDVVVSRPVSAGDVRVGKVLLVDDPDQPGHLRMHRYVEDGPRGTLVTKGDANPQQDSTPVEPSAVHGIAFLRVPFVGAPIVWLRGGEWGKIGMLALGLVAVLALCTVDGSLRRLVEPAGSSSDDDPSPDAGDGPDGVGDGREARVDPAPHVPSDATTVVSRRTLRRSARRTRRSRRLGGAAVVLVLAGGAGVLLPSEAVAAPWSHTTSTSTSFAALTVPPATALTCTANGDGSVNIGFAYGGPTATSFSVMSGTTVLATGATSPVRVTGSGLLNLGQVYTVTVRVNYLGNWTSTSTATTRVQTALVGTTLSCA